MKVHLLHPDHDIDPDVAAAKEPALVKDLELTTLFNAMADGDRFLWDIAARLVLDSLSDPDTIRYRQRVLTDCRARPEVVRRLYDLAVDAVGTPRKVWFGILSRSSPDVLLRRSDEIMKLLSGNLRQLREIADAHSAEFASDGFGRFFRMVAEELDDGYLDTVEDQLRELELRHGTLISAGLGSGNTGTGHLLHRPPQQTWWERLIGVDGPGLSFEIPARDEAGGNALTELQGQGVAVAAIALARSVDHVLGFFRRLRVELAFYLGCLNLQARLTAGGAPTCLPEPHPPGRPVLSARGLYDPCLSLTLQERPVGNDIDADDRNLVIITGANRGGKSTFLRALGVAQLMLQAGMFAPAESIRADLRTGVFTHFKREEAAELGSGKLDEELSRMNKIAYRLRPGALLLCNESFASTNEREGSEIARHVIRAATEAGVKVLFVTHLYDLAHGLYRQDLDTALFLRAERLPDGRRTFRLVPGEPLPTSYGQDSYQRVLGAGSGDPAGPAAHAAGAAR